MVKNFEQPIRMLKNNLSWKIVDRIGLSISQTGGYFIS